MPVSKLHIIEVLNSPRMVEKRRQKISLLCFSADKNKLRTFFFHFGLLVLCICYVIAGSIVFYWIEKPFELSQRNHTIEVVDRESLILLHDTFHAITYIEEYETINKSVQKSFDDFSSKMFELYQNPISANVFDELVYNNCCNMASWNSASALLLASTTVIPVGFGFITPLTPQGRLFLVLYAIVGIPLSLMVTSDIGKFICGYIFKFLNDSPWRSMIALSVLLASYPFLMGLLVSLISQLSFVDSIYYSVMCIFTIGYGDILPPIPVPVLILLIVFGVTLVTVSLELVGSTVIHNVHYMGRHMHRAREIAGRVIKLAQKINVNRGLTLGISQLNAFTRLGMSMNVMHTIAIDTPNDAIIRKDTAFEPSIPLDFVDFASTSEIVIDEKDYTDERMDSV